LPRFFWESEKSSPQPIPAPSLKQVGELPPEFTATGSVFLSPPFGLRTLPSQLEEFPVGFRDPATRI
jgi:hypothetical protein